jgi:hypothetical protein
MFKNLIILLLSSVILASTTPSKDKHIDVIKEELLKELRSDLKPKSSADFFGVGVASMIGEGVITTLLKGTNHQSYFLYSTLTDHKGAIISVGALGQVFVLRELK